MTVRAVLLLALIAISSAASAERPDLSWLSGYWCTRGDGTSSEEYWLPERGGLMLGLNRSVGKKRTNFEFMRIEIAADGARFIGQPSGVPPTIFTMISASGSKASFANPQHDFPKRVHYARSGDTLTARVDDGSDSGKALEFKWELCAPPVPITGS
jgi:hypothetical protein